jgi:hypothetical protein
MWNIHISGMVQYRHLFPMNTDLATNPACCQHFRYISETPELCINLSSSSTFPCPFFTQQNCLLNYGSSEWNSIQEHRPMYTCSNQIHRGNAEGSEGQYDCTEFYLYPFFLGYIGCSVGNCTSKQQQHTKILLAARQNKINKSSPFAILIIRNIYSPDLCRMIRVY